MNESEGDRQDGRLMRTASRALGWSVANTLLSRVGTLGIGVVLARLLGPTDFGVYAVAYLALVAVLSFNELGISLAIVRWPGDPRNIAATVNTLSTAASVLIAGLVYAAAPTFSDAMGDPHATPVVRLLGLSVIVSGVVAGPAALMQRLFLQRRRLVIDQVNVWTGALVSIALAADGMGAMSLAIGRIAGATASGLLFVTLSPEPYRFGIDVRQLRPLARFGLPLAAASILVFAVGNADQIVVGRMLGATALGFYALAFNLSSWPVSVFSLPLRNVAPAMFSRLQNDPELMRRRLWSLTGVLMAMAVPSCLLIAGDARPIVRLVYGPAWEPAAAPLAWLAILATLKIFFELTYDYLVVVGASHAILRLQVATLAATVPALVIGAKASGIAGVAAAQVVVAAGVLLPLYLHRLHKVSVNIRSIVVRLGRPVVAGTMVGLSAVAVGTATGADLLTLFAGAALCVGTIVALLVLDRDELSRLGVGAGPATRARHRAEPYRDLVSSELR